MAAKKKEPKPSTTGKTDAAKVDPDPNRLPSTHSTNGPSSSTASAESPAQSKTPKTSAPTSVASPRWPSGSWRGKANAVAQVAHDNVPASGTTPPPPPSPKPVPASASSNKTPTKLLTQSKSAATIQLSRDDKDQQELKTPPKDTNPTNGSLDKEDKPPPVKPFIDPKETVKSDETVEKQQPLPSGWMGWWARSGTTTQDKDHPDTAADDGPGSKSEPSSVKPESGSNVVGKSASSKNLQSQEPKKSPEKTEIVKDGKHDGPKVEGDDQSRPTPANGISREQATASLQGQDQEAIKQASWFGLWNSSQAHRTGQTNPQKAAPAEPAASNIASDGYSPLDPEMTEPERVPKLETEQRQRVNAPMWAFWSSDTASKNASLEKQQKPKEEPGELAVAGSSTAGNPQPAVMTEPETPKPATPKLEKDVKALDKVKHVSPALRPQSLSARSTTSLDAKNQESTPRAPTVEDKSERNGDDSTASITASLKRAVQKHKPVNLLLPGLQETYPVETSPSYLQSIMRILARRPGKSTGDQKHLALTTRPLKIQKAVAIGIHGYFPAPLIQKVLGPPSGTSLKFANHAASAISRWLSEHQDPHSTFSVEKIALEGEGMVLVRLDTLWKLLLTFIDHLRGADLVVIACHSQGVPVSIMLLARLISFGVLPAHTRIAVCGMAGVSLGPFAEYKSRILGSGSASELFEFSRHDSSVSQQYRKDLEHCLKHQVRIMLVGSIDDQLVSLESALFSTVSHPYIYRAVFVDGRIHAPGFITALMGLACKLRNLGISDHGLFRELSAPLAGSLYGGEGHSRIYEDEKVYDLGVAFAMETADFGSAEQSRMEKYDIPSPQNANPYFLPWAMRGVLAEPFVRSEMRSEIDELVRLFEDWKPQTKQLKDVKVRPVPRSACSHHLS